VARGRVVLVSALLGVLGVGVVAAGVVGHRLWRVVSDPMGVAGGVRLVYAVDFEHPWEAGRGRAELLRRTVDCLEKRARSANDSAIARAAGNQIEVLLPALGRPLPIDITKRQLSRSGRVEFRQVDDGSAAMTNLVAQLLNEPQPGVGSDLDQWTDRDGGATHYDQFLTGEMRERLEAAIRALTSNHPIAADHELLFEHRASDWRSYYVFRQVHMDNGDVVSADVGTPPGEHPEVLLELTEDGRRKQEALTRGAIGHKIAIVFEGRIVTAPVVIGPMNARRARITMNAYDEGVALQDARDLVAVLRTPGLPAPVTLVREENVAAKR
jgi:preprotein translocase subunit SecD